MFVWRETVAALAGQPGLDLAVTSRLGGVSVGAYAELNLGGAVGDEPWAVAANRAAVAAAVGVDADSLLIPAQCHSADVAVVDGPWSGSVPAVDALVTTSTSVALAVLVADCVPVLLADREAGVVGVAHAGRRGLVAGVLSATLAAMQDCGAQPAHTAAVVGPSVCDRCYEVPRALADEVVSAVPATAATSWTGTPALDLAAGVVAQLTDAGLAVRRLGGCTRESRELFSYRRDGVTGRFAGVARLFLPAGSDRSGRSAASAGRTAP